MNSEWMNEWMTGVYEWMKEWKKNEWMTERIKEWLNDTEYMYDLCKLTNPRKGIVDYKQSFLVARTIDSPT